MEKAIVIRGYVQGDRTEILDKYLKKGWTVKFAPVSFRDGEDVLVIIQSPPDDQQ